MEQVLSVLDLKATYPNEWILLGNPVMDQNEIDVLSGVPLYHSKDKNDLDDDLTRFFLLHWLYFLKKKARLMKYLIC